METNTEANQEPKALTQEEQLAQQIAMLDNNLEGIRNVLALFRRGYFHGKACGLVVPCTNYMRSLENVAIQNRKHFEAMLRQTKATQRPGTAPLAAVPMPESIAPEVPSETAAVAGA